MKFTKVHFKDANSYILWVLVVGVFYKMTGAFVALASAGMGTVLVSWSPYNQIIPAVLGSLWLVFCLIYFPRAFKKAF